MIYKEKRGTLPLLILLLEVLEKPCNKNKQVTPTPNMKCHQTEQSTRDALRRDIHIPRAFTAFLLWAGEILQDFRKPKQALINAFYNMSAKSIRLCGCKGSELFWIEQDFCNLIVKIIVRAI